MSHDYRTKAPGHAVGLRYPGILAVLVLPLTAALVHAEEAPWEAFEYEALLEQHREQGRDYLRFLDQPSISMGLYRLAGGATDTQQPHSRDEVYYVTAGSATLIIDDERHAVRAGSIAFVRANVAHRFVDISDDLDVLVVFVAAPSDAEDPAGAVFHVDDLRMAASADENVWNQFLQVSTMRFGLYLLPQSLGGDDALTHTVDEVNIVVGGSARFHVGDDAMDVAPGSIVHVASGNPHFFRQLSGDFEVLILFAAQPEAG